VTRDEFFGAASRGKATTLKETKDGLLQLDRWAARNQRKTVGCQDCGGGKSKGTKKFISRV
jgi:hypothetical protein